MPSAGGGLSEEGWRGVENLTALDILIHCGDEFFGSVSRVQLDFCIYPLLQAKTSQSDEFII
jgi:hypothetical protein